MRALIAIALACSMWLACAASEPPKDEIAKATNSQQTRSGDQRGTSANPLVVATIPAQPSEVQARNERTEKEKKSFYDWLSAWSTFSLAVITLLLAVMTTGLAVFTLKLWRATGDLVRGAEDTSKHELRAYVAIDGAV